MRRALLVMLAGAGCLDTQLPGPPPPPLSGVVLGTVVFAEPGQSSLRPAVGAIIQVVGQDTSTRASAETAAFRLSPVSSRDETLSFRFDQDGDGHFERQRLVRLKDHDVGPGKTVTLGEVVLGSNATIRGQVVREDVQTTGGHGGTSVLIPEGPFFTFTGDDGTFQLDDLPEGLLTVSTFRVGYKSVAETIEVRAAEVFSLKKLALTPSAGSELAEIKGRVLLSDGAPASGVTVTLSSGAKASSDELGAYSFRGVPYGVASLGFQKAGFRTVTLVNLVIGAPTLFVRDVTLEPGESTNPQLDAGLPVFDAGVDAGFDAGVDAGFDAGVDAGFDAGVDAGFDAGVDAGFDAGVDAGFDAGVDAGSDAGFDAGVDAGFDAGIDAGAPPRAIIDAPLFVSPGAAFTLTGQQSTGNVPLSFFWAQDAGPTFTIVNNGTPLAATVRLNAPPTPTLLKFNLTVQDPSGRASPPATAVIPVAVPPIATITNVPPSALGGQRLILSGATSSDPNNSGIVNYAWSVTPTNLGIVVTPLAGGLVQLDLPTPVLTPVVVSVRLTVTNGLTLTTTSAPATFNLNVGALPQWAVDAGPPQSVGVGVTVTLVGGLFTPQPNDGGITFRWTPDREPDSGVADWILTDPTALVTTFVAPRVDGPVPRAINFTLTATDTTGLLSPPISVARTTINVVDTRPPQVATTSVTEGRTGLWSGFVEFDEDIANNLPAFNSVSIQLVGTGPATNTVARILDGRRLWLVQRPPLTPGYQYALRASSITDTSLPNGNPMTGQYVQNFFATARWSPAWETSWSSSSDVSPALIARRPGPGQPVQLFVVGRRNGVGWASMPFDPLSCTTPPCVIPDDPSVPVVTLTGPRVRGKRGTMLKNTPVATLQVPDLTGTPAVTWWWNNGLWQPLPAAPPGTVFGSSNALFSPYADDAGFKLATWDGGAWQPFAVLSTDTTEFSVDATSDPIGFGVQVGSTFQVDGRSSKTGTLRRFPFNGTTFIAGTLVTGVSPIIDARPAGDWNGAGGGAMYQRQSGTLDFFCLLSCFAGPYPVTTGVSSFDSALGPSHDLDVVSVNGQLELRTGTSNYPLQVGVVRAGLPSMTINNDPLCTADRPEIVTFDGRFAVAWQERCGSGPWKVYVRIAE